MLIWVSTLPCVNVSDKTLSNHPPKIKPSVRHCRASRSKFHLSLLCCNQWVKTIDQCHHLSQVVLQNPSGLHPLGQWQSDILPCTPAATCAVTFSKFKSSSGGSSTRRIKSSRAFVGSMFLALGQKILVHLALDQLIPSMQNHQWCVWCEEMNTEKKAILLNTPYIRNDKLKGTCSHHSPIWVCSSFPRFPGAGIQWRNEFTQSRMRKSKWQWQLPALLSQMLSTKTSGIDLVLALWNKKWAYFSHEIKLCGSKCLKK